MLSSFSMHSHLKSENKEMKFKKFKALISLIFSYAFHIRRCGKSSNHSLFLLMVSAIYATVKPKLEINIPLTIIAIAYTIAIILN